MPVTNVDSIVWLRRALALLIALVFAFVVNLTARAVGISALELISVVFVPVLLGQTALNAWRNRQR